MNSQLPYQKHSATSKEAARLAKSSAKNARDRVMDYLRNCGKAGATDERIANDLGLNHSTERPRRVELVRLGLVIDSGLQALSASGRWCTVWVLREFRGGISR